MKSEFSELEDAKRAILPPMPRELLDIVPAILRDRIPGLLDGTNWYRWFSSENFEMAWDCLQALCIAAKRGPSPQVAFFAAEVANLFQKDRADRAAAFRGGEIHPIREIPGMLFEGDRAYLLNLWQLSPFVPELPPRALAIISQLLITTQDPPDRLLLAIYEDMLLKPQPHVATQYMPGQSLGAFYEEVCLRLQLPIRDIDLAWTYADRWIYAQFGTWFVELAHWQ